MHPSNPLQAPCTHLSEGGLGRGEVPGAELVDPRKGGVVLGEGEGDDEVNEEIRKGSSSNSLPVMARIVRNFRELKEQHHCNNRDEIFRYLSCNENK